MMPLRTALVAMVALLPAHAVMHRDYEGAPLDLRTLVENATRAATPRERCPSPDKDVKKEPGMRGTLLLYARGVSAVRVRGLFNTGTNYCSSLLNKLGFPESRVDGGGFLDGSGVKRWKHAPLSSEYNYFVPANWNEVNLVVTRHPVPWALSTMTRSYELHCECTEASKAAYRASGRHGVGGRRRLVPRGCREVGVKNTRGDVTAVMDWDAVLRGPCSWPSQGGIDLRPQPRSDGGLGDVWSVYYGSYLAAPNALFLRYEDLIRDPVAAVERVADAAHCDLPPMNARIKKELDAVAHQRTGFFKEHAEVAESEHEAVLSQAWRSEIAGGRLAAFCATVNATTLARLRYTCVDAAYNATRPASPLSPAAVGARLDAAIDALGASVAALEAAKGALRAALH